jgi:hypothetical protein
MDVVALKDGVVLDRREVPQSPPLLHRLSVNAGVPWQQIEDVIPHQTFASADLCVVVVDGGDPQRFGDVFAILKSRHGVTGVLDVRLWSGAEVVL